MEKQIVKLSYCLGLLSAVIALVLRAINALGMLLPTAVKQGQTISYMSFYKGALLFLLVSVATSNIMWARGQKG